MNGQHDIKKNHTTVPHVVEAAHRQLQNFIHLTRLFLPRSPYSLVALEPEALVVHSCILDTAHTRYIHAHRQNIVLLLTAALARYNHFDLFAMHRRGALIHKHYCAEVTSSAPLSLAAVLSSVELLHQVLNGGRGLLKQIIQLTIPCRRDAESLSFDAAI